MERTAGMETGKTVLAASTERTSVSGGSAGCEDRCQHDRARDRAVEMAPVRGEAARNAKRVLLFEQRAQRKRGRPDDRRRLGNLGIGLIDVDVDAGGAPLLD